ncbi:lipopolysaccharide export system protein LptA [Marinomonas communis]|jgi:lipopolysaccharide export system protein LptA|uniref:Lipopolysaccharide export system protein LptA n=2 Tax=Marinomonas communis TaxID=28254 RepID=A0A4V3DGS1_9GAMM|nr:lipopolysaccharide export system protein LptA [Marinomonas communis]
MEAFLDIMKFQSNKHFIAWGLLSLTSSAAYSLPTDLSQPINIEADKAAFDQKEGTANYSGNVVVIQGSIRIEAQSLTINTNPETGEFESLAAKGTPSLFTQQLNEAGDQMKATGNTLNYNVANGQLEIHKNGYLQRGEDEISADFIHYLLNNGTFNAENRGSGRVNMTLQPVQSEQAN